MTQGFYKKDMTQILFSPDIVEGPTYSLASENKNDYTYPIDGWIWADNLDDAISKFTSSIISYPAYHVLPENIYLAVSGDDETEFNKLTTLIILGIDKNRLLPSSIITVHDADKVVHQLTVERFLDIMVDYGLYCYSTRH
jgi:hypothetical protein